jgi:PAS domain S-box-containing protein
MSPKAKLYVGVVISAGFTVLGSSLIGWQPHEVFRFLCYLALAIPASCLKVSLPGVTGTMSVLFVFLLAGVAELQLPETLITGAVCVVAQSIWHARDKVRAVQVSFSVANITLATAATYELYRATLLVPNPFRLGAAASLFFVLNTLPIAVVIALTEDKSFRKVWTDCYFWSFPYYLVGAAIVGALSFTSHTIDWRAGVLIVPVVYVIYRSYLLYLRQLQAERDRAREEAQHAEEEHRHAAEIAALHARTMDALNSSLSANAKLDTVIRSSPLAVISLDAGGNVTGWNAAAEHMLGWSPEEVIGRRVPFAAGGSEQPVLRLVSQTLAGEAVSGIEMRQCRKDGTPFEAAMWTAILREGEGVSGVLLTIADVSDRKRLEEQLRLSQKLEAVGRLAGGIAHDFNNLLTVINGYSALLIDTVSGHQYAVSQAEEILNAGTRAAELVSQLLTFSRRQLIKPRALNVVTFVEGVARMLQRIIGEHIELRTDFRGDPGYIYADLNQMEGVLLNLATNARDAMPDGGVLTITAGPIDVVPGAAPPHADLPPAGYMRLIVRDTGHGMSAETLQRLFEPFFTTKPQGKGTGLGLSSVYGGVEQNGGRIFCESELGKGTAFSIYLPRIPKPEADERETRIGRQSSRGTETILLVEDEAMVRRMMRDALSNAGYRVWESANGAQALQQWGSQIDRIDLVVTDVVMPVMNGLVLIEELRKRRPDIKALCMSGHSDDMLTLHRDLNPVPELLRKPFLPEVLVRKARELLDVYPRGGGYGSRERHEQARYF